MFGFNSNNKSISPKDAYDRLNAKEDIFLLDVRTPEEYKEKHIPNSVNIPLNLLAQIEKKVPDKTKTMFVYCLSGSRSAAACNFLKKAGYTDIYNLGGISSWRYETVR